MIKFYPSSVNGVLVVFSQTIDEKTNAKIYQCVNQIKTQNKSGIGELVPAYCSLLVYYDPFILSFDEVCEFIKSFELDNFTPKNEQDIHVINIPTLYDGQDLEFVAKYNGISIDEVVKIHTCKHYLVYMLGFMPGFAYLGGLNQKLYTPRLKTPRKSIQAGSVGIADKQTGIYPLSSPGGWQIIGKTPLKLYDVKKTNPCVIKAGNYIKFQSINPDEFAKIQEQVNNNTYQIQTQNIPKRAISE